jgi:MSHA pilin protein MshA
MKNMNKYKGKGRFQAGFTLIELIVVITIIAILAATALPRFVNLQTDARVSKANGLMGAVKSASGLAKSRCLADLAINGGTATAANPCTATGGTVLMDGVSPTMLNQYPTPNLAGILTAAGILAATDGFTTTTATAGALTTFTINVNGGTAGSCSVTYVSSTAVNTAPVIGINTTAC